MKDSKFITPDCDFENIELPKGFVTFNDYNNDMKTTVSKINEITKYCMSNGIHFEYSPHVNLFRVYIMNDKFETLFTLNTYIEGNLKDYSDISIDVVTIDELLTELKTYIKKLK